MRLFDYALVLLAGFSVFGEVAPVDARGPAGPMYQIDVRCYRTMPDGREYAVSSPCVATIEGRPAVVRVGDTIRPPEGVELEEPLESGTSYRIRVFRNRDRLFLELSGRLADTSRADADGVRMTTMGVHVVEAVTVGKKIVVPLPEGQKGRWEVLVQEVMAGQGTKPLPWREGLEVAPSGR